MGEVSGPRPGSTGMLPLRRAGQNAVEYFGYAVTQLREARGWSQRQLAVAAHMERSGVSRLESGTKTPTEELAGALDRALGVGGRLIELAAAARAESSAQLPPATGRFVGRTAELRQLDGLLNPSVATSSYVVLIAGPPGVGKTALALWWANSARKTYDTVLWADLRGYSGDLRADGTPNRAPTEILEDLLRGLGLSPSRIPKSEELRLRALQLQLIERKRVLLVLDNARDLDQIRTVLPGTPGTTVLVTSRRLIRGLALEARVIHVPLAPMDDEDSAELLSGLVGEERANAEPAAMAQLARLCAALPLAMTIAGHRVGAEPARSIQQQVRALADRGLLEGDEHGIGVRAVFSWSYQGLPAEEAGLFRLLGLHPGPRFGTGAAAALAGVPPADAAVVLERLARAHLVEQLDSDVYRLHDLLRAYAAAEIAEPQWDAERDAARRRLVYWYLHAVNAAAWALTPERDHHVHLDPPPEGVCPPGFDTAAAAMAWCAAEIPSITPITQLAYDHGMLWEAWKIPGELIDYYLQARPWQTWQTSYEIAIAAARQAGENEWVAEASDKLAEAHRRQGRTGQAAELSQVTADLLEPLRPHPRLGWAYVGLGNCAHAEGRYDDAVALILRGVDAHVEAGTWIGEYAARAELCRAYRSIGDHAEALKQGRLALDAFTEVGDQHARGFVLVPLARAARAADDLEQALEYCDAAVEAYRASYDQWGEAEALGEKGLVLAELGEVESARVLLREAREIMEPIDSGKARQLGDEIAELAPDDQ